MSSETIDAIMQLFGIVTVTCIFIAVTRYQRRIFKKRLQDFVYDIEKLGINSASFVYLGDDPKFEPMRKKRRGNMTVNKKSIIFCFHDQDKTYQELMVDIDNVWASKPIGNNLRIRLEPSKFTKNVIKIDDFDGKHSVDDRGEMIAIKLYEYLIDNGAQKI